MLGSQISCEAALCALQMLRLLPRDVELFPDREVAHHRVFSEGQVARYELKGARRREVPAPEVELFLDFVVPHTRHVSLAWCVCVCVRVPRM
jgi:hypothetical protein